jgi:5-hydroxyisourate hydrolase
MKLTTHVLDLSTGCPAAGMDLTLADAGGQVIVAARTNGDGRVERPLLESVGCTPGVYVLTFHVGDYFRAAGVVLPDPPFLDVVPIRFGIAQDRHYHVPLLVSPYGYSTYRGS